ncbi:MAG: radical SAM protein [Thermoleophilia bacterium]|nr:radical SAM protein [Thermoleophilia bacterium]
MDRLVPPLPRELQVEVTGACNLACRMCLVRYRPKLGRRQGAMCFHTFKQIVDELPDLEKLTLQGLGEPMLAPDFFEMVEYATARGIRTGFNTNGTFLTRAAAERLVRAGVDWLHVSLDGATAETYEGVRDGADFARVRGNIRGLVEARRTLGAERPTVQIVFVAMRRNVDELPQLVRLAAELGVESVWVQNLSHSFSDTDPAGSYREIRDFAAEEALWAEADEHAGELFDQAAALAHELEIELRLPRLEEPDWAATRRPGAPGCHWTFTEAYVTHDGKAQPCCMVMGSDRAALGDVEQDGFARVWRNAAYREFRAGLLGDDPPEVCRGCSLYRRVF